MIVFVDTSALGGLYLGDASSAPWVAEVVFDGGDPVVVCELADVELASLLARARRDGRIDERGVAQRLQQYADHTADSGPIGVVPVTGVTLSRARTLVLGALARTRDAIHLAAAQLLAEGSADDVEVLTLDARQAVAAEALGIRLRRAPAT